MRPANKIEKLIGQLQDCASAELDERTLKDVFSVMAKSMRQQKYLFEHKPSKVPTNRCTDKNTWRV